MRRWGTAGARYGGVCGFLILLVPLACAYYNTFFVAKKSFNQAEKVVAESKTEIIPAEAKRRYQATLDQCHKMLIRHGESKWIDDTIYLMAASHYGIGEYDSALIRLEELDHRFPDSSFRPDALFLGGLTQTKRHEYGAADSLFETVIAEYPNFHRRDEILYTLANTAASRREKDQAVAFYEELIREFPKSRLVDASLEQVGQLHFDDGRYDSAAVFFGQLLGTTRDEEVERNAAVLQAQTLVRLDRAEEALELLQRYEPEEVEQDPAMGRVPQAQSTATEDLARLQLQKAVALNHLKRHREAMDVLDGITQRHRASSYAVEAQFQIGYTYETLVDSLDAARAAYEKVSALPGRSIFKQQALQRANALRSMAELQEEAGSGDAALEARADAALRIAEILYLEREMVPEAIEKYREVQREFPETNAASRAAYALAYIDWKVEGDSLGAHEKFRQIVTDYPASSQARDAIRLLVSHQADTSGLAELLVLPEPDSTLLALPVWADSLAAFAESLGDSTAAALVDSLRSSRVPRLPAGADTVETKLTRADSLRRAMRSRVPVDSLRTRADSLRRAMGPPEPADSLVPEEPLIPSRSPVVPDSSERAVDPSPPPRPRTP